MAVKILFKYATKPLINKKKKVNFKNKKKGRKYKDKKKDILIDWSKK